MQLNGFEIEKYNQYGFPEKARTHTCPLCSQTRRKKLDKCVRVKWDRGLAVCYHCGALMQLHTYRKHEKTNPARQYKRPPAGKVTGLTDAVIQWFASRGISTFTLRRAGVTQAVEYMPQSGCDRTVICFNYLRQGELVNVKYRTADKHFKMVSGAELIMYNQDLCAVSADVVVCEGEMDALSFMEAGIFHAVSVPNGSTLQSANLEYVDNSIGCFENKKRIYLALDNDEPGRNTTRELIRRFGAERCFLVDLSDCKDANEFLMKYGSAKLKETLANAREVPIDGVSSSLHWKAELNEYLINGMQQGYRTGIGSFDGIFSTYTGQYIVVTGKPSSGKSDFVDMMCLGYYRQYGWRTAIASPENKPDWIHAGKILSKLCGTWLDKPEYQQTEWYGQAVRMHDDMFKYIDNDSYDLEAVLEKTRSLIFRYGIKVLVVDPYNKVRLRSSLHKNTNEYTNDYLVMIDEFARRHDILIILVAHPNKPSAEERRSYEPDFYSVKGGGEFYDMSPHGLLVHRDEENDLVKIKVLKVKFFHLGRNGAYVWMKWNTRNGRYIDFEVQNDDPAGVRQPLIDNTNWAAGELTQLQPIK